MKKLTDFILKKYQQMPGDKKIRLGLSLSEMVRKVRASGLKSTGA